MKKRFLNCAFAAIGAWMISGGVASAAVLFDGPVTILSTSPTQLGRLSRDGVIPDWTDPKAFPGTINPTVTYHYTTVTLLVPNWLSFLQISIDSINPNIFTSIYDTSYNPNPVPANRGLAVNYMGDEGSSGNFFGTDPAFFQVVNYTAAHSSSGFGTVVLVVNETTANAGLNSPVGLVVEGFSDSNFNEVPEPVTSAMFGAGVLVLGVVRSRRRRAA